MASVFGPVPSRRLGRSLGVDPVPFKTCNWNCVYCQLGHTSPLTAEHRSETRVQRGLPGADEGDPVDPVLAVRLHGRANLGQDLVNRNVREGRLSFTTNTPEAVAASLVVFVAAPTPPR